MIPKVSILIPCYNSSAWIRQSVESALAQSYANKEVIIADDGSTDGSYDEIEKFGDKIRCIQLKHSGSNVTRNELLRMASGEWIQYLDADDYLLSHKISEQLQSISEIAGVDVIYSPVFLEESIQGRCTKRRMDMPSKTDLYINFIRWGPLQTGGLLFRRDALLDVSGWNEKQLVCQEHELMLRLILANKNIQLVNHALSVYRRPGGATISTRDKKFTIQQRMRITDELETYLMMSGLLTESRKYAINLSRFECARDIYALDSTASILLVDKIVKADPVFRPAGTAAPWCYRLLYELFGFQITQKIALALSVIKKRCLNYVKAF